MMFTARKLLLAALVLAMAPALNAQAPPDEEEVAAQRDQALLESLHPVTGDIDIPESEAVLHLGKDYYFLPASEAKRVLVEGWGNPPEVASDVLGLVLPTGKTFLDDTWAAVISYEKTGYVTDEDAKSADYTELLEELQSGEDELNEKYRKEGYPAQHLVGWAQTPTYDPKSHSVIWAQNVQFEGQDDNTLNYDIRLLGRRGVLSLNMLTTMSKLDETRLAAAKFGQAASFKQGARYADYVPGSDAKAEYGVAGLVAAGVGVAAVKKLGLLAVILAFGKKFIVLIIAVLVGLGAGFRRRLGLGRKKDEHSSEYTREEESPLSTGEADSEPADKPVSGEARKNDHTDQ